MTLLIHSTSMHHHPLENTPKLGLFDLDTTDERIGDQRGAMVVMEDH